MAYQVVIISNNTGYHWRAALDELHLDTKLDEGDVRLNNPGFAEFLQRRHLMNISLSNAMVITLDGRTIEDEFTAYLMGGPEARLISFLRNINDHAEGLLLCLFAEWDEGDEYVSFTASGEQAASFMTMTRMLGLPIAKQGVGSIQDSDRYPIVFEIVSAFKTKIIPS